MRLIADSCITCCWISAISQAAWPRARHPHPDDDRGVSRDRARITDDEPVGPTKADTYVSVAKLRDLEGNLVGTYHVAYTFTDELDEEASA